MALLAEQENDVGEIALVRGCDDVGCARAVATHPHIERAVEAEGKAAFRLVELHRGHADVEHDAVDPVGAALAGDVIEIGKTVFDQREPASVSYTHLRAHETDSYLV